MGVRVGYPEGTRRPVEFSDEFSPAGIDEARDVLVMQVEHREELLKVQPGAQHCEVLYAHSSGESLQQVSRLGLHECSGHALGTATTNCGVGQREPLLDVVVTRRAARR